MRRIRSVYLAGPSIHPRHGVALAEAAQQLCQAAGFTALDGQLGVLTEREPSEAMAREIYAERISRLRQADAAIVNLTPFRGPHCDPAVAFEAGFMAGLGKPVFAYMNVVVEEDAELSSRVEGYVGAERDEEGVWRDELGAAIEDFGLPESLMLWAEARRLYVIVTADIQGDLTGLHLCLEAVQLYAD
jgi:nucleoside 2-deoxyribosyltransferase